MTYLYNLNLYAITILLSSLSLSYVIGPSVLNIVVILISILTIFIIGKHIYKLNFDFYNKYVLIFFFYYFYILTLSFYSDNYKLSFSNTLPFIKFFFLFVALKTIIQEKIISLKNFLILFSLPFFFIVVISIFQISINLVYENKIQYENFSGIFFEEKILGSFISRYLPIVVGIFFILFKSRKKNIYILLLIVFSFVIILFSLERAALINFISFIILLFIFQIFKFNLKYFLLIILVIISVFFLSFNIKNLHFGLVNKTFNQVNYEKINVPLPIPDHYLLHYLSALEMFKQNQLFGIAPKMFREKCSLDEYNFNGWDLYEKKEPDYGLPHTQKKADENAQIARINTLSSCSTHPHHMHIQILAETGFIGYIFFILLIFLIFGRYFQLLKNENDNILLYKSFLIAIIINLSPFTTSGNVFSSYFGTMIFFPLLFFLVDKKI